MPRKRLTQLFPRLIPLRRWQRKKLFYLKMRFDRNRYAIDVSDVPLPFLVHETREATINPHTGYDLVYQYNKTHNLDLAARRVNGVLLRPGETFSFWRLVRDADRETPYKDGLVLVDGRIVPSYGGGLCQLSNLLHLLFLHSPLTVTERHGHPVEDLPPNPGQTLLGVDATVHEGWLDLRARNDTGNTFQLMVQVRGEELWGQLLSLTPVGRRYQVHNGQVLYRRVGDAIYETAEVARTETEDSTGEAVERHLYTNLCRIRYPLPEGTQITDEESDDHE